VSSDRAAFLRRVPVLADLEQDLLEKLAGEAGELKLRAGDWLFREGDEAQSLFVIRSGRLEIVSEGDPGSVIRNLRRGDVLGELALLGGGERSASARARRDSHLIELGREQFEHLIADAPAFAVGLTRAMGAQLAASRTPVVTATAPRTIAALPLDASAPVEEAAELLVDALSRFGTVARLGAGDAGADAEMLDRLERAERENERVVMVADSAEPGSVWTDFCVREADVVFALSSGSPARPWIERPDALRGCELVVLGPGVEDEVLAALSPREVQVLPAGSDLQPSLDMTARRLTGNSIGVVLSGGGARAFAHLGVMEELGRAGVVVDRYAGVSLGSFVAGGLAAGHDPQALSEVVKPAFTDANPTGDYTLPLFSMIRGHRTRGLLDGFFGQTRIEELRSRYFCLSCDLVGREPVIHRTGPLRDAVRASLSIPGVFPPIATPDGKLLVDGGVLDNLPVGTMARSGEGPVIAVDVTGKMGDFKKPVRPGVARLGRPVRRYLTGSESELPRLGETIVRTVTVGSIDTAEAARRHADLVIQPAVEGVGLLDWTRLESMMELGRAAARAALEQPPAWIEAGVTA
jgi:NTE family protein